jgi:hypothetical protein
MLSRAVAALLVAIGVTGCLQPFESPSFFGGEFVLIDVDGLGLPATGPSVHGLPGSQLVAGSMSLDPGGTGYIMEQRADSQNNPFSVATQYRYRVKGTSIRFDYIVPCGTNPQCSPPPTGEITNDGLQVRVTFPPTSNFKVYTFRTVPQTI